MQLNLCLIKTVLNEIWYARVSSETPRIVDVRTCISRTSAVFMKAKVKENLRRTIILLLYILTYLLHGAESFLSS